MNKKLKAIFLFSSVLCFDGVLGKSFARECPELTSYMINANNQCVDLSDLVQPRQPTNQLQDSDQRRYLQPLRVSVVSEGVIPNSEEVGIDGDTEFIEGRFGQSRIGLVTYVRSRPGEICLRTRQTKQDVFVRPLDPNTGIPVNRAEEKLIGGDECGIPAYSDAEFGLDKDDRPLVAYTSETGVNLVQFEGENWEEATYTNQPIPGSERWFIAGEPLSVGLNELQLKVLEGVNLSQAGITYRLIWSKLVVGPNNSIAEVLPIWQFPARGPDSANFRSRLFPGDPTRFIRVSNGGNGIFEFSDDGQDLREIYSAELKGLIRAWSIPAAECFRLGLSSSNISDPCPAVVLGNVDENNNAYLKVLAQSSTADWIEILKVPYYFRQPRVNVTVLEHLSPPRSVIFATGDNEARLYALDGSSYEIAEDFISTKGSELLYFSETQLLGTYYREEDNPNGIVKMIQIVDF